MRIEFPNSARGDFFWTQSVLRIGSAPDNDLILAAQQAAAHHARIQQDRRGLVWTVCREIAAAGHSIRSAHLSTYGTEARDVFYLVDADNGRPLDDDAALAVRTAIAEALR